MDLSAAPRLIYSAGRLVGCAEPVEALDARLADTARRMVAVRDEMAHYFPKAVFHDEVWDVMLELFIAHCDGRETSVKQAVLSTGLPSTSALRILERLEKAALIDRLPDDLDHRRVNVRLSPRGMQGITLVLAKLSGQHEDFRR